MYTIIVSLPENLLTTVEPYRQKYDPLNQVIPPHITLVDPFQFTAPLDTLVDHLKEVGDFHSPIKVFLVGWDSYESKEYQLHVPMTAGHKQLVTLHYDILGGPLSYLAGKITDYWPRVIFGRFSPAQQLEFETAKKELADFTPKFVARIKHIELLHRDDLGQSWQRLYQFGLKATMAGRARRESP